VSEETSAALYLYGDLSIRQTVVQSMHSDLEPANRDDPSRDYPRRYQSSSTLGDQMVVLGQQMAERDAILNMCMT
jgi:hypothetical protein